MHHRGNIHAGSSQARQFDKEIAQLNDHRYPQARSPHANP